MKITTLIIRILLGFLFLVNSVGLFLKLFPEPETEGNFKAFQIGLVASSYLITGKITKVYLMQNN